MMERAAGSAMGIGDAQRSERARVDGRDDHALVNKDPLIERYVIEEDMLDTYEGEFVYNRTKA